MADTYDSFRIPPDLISEWITECRPHNYKKQLHEMFAYEHDRTQPAQNANDAGKNFYSSLKHF